MELCLILLLLLNDFAVAENAASAALRNRKGGEHEGQNKLVPQKVYAVPKVGPKYNPVQVNLRSDNRLNNVPKVIIPTVNHQKNTITPADSIEAKPINKVSNQEVTKDSSKAVSQNDTNQKPKDDIQQVQETKPKERKFFEEVDTDDFMLNHTKKTTIDKEFQENTLQDKTNKQDLDTISLPETKPNEEKSVTAVSPKSIPIVNEHDFKLIPVNENINIKMPEIPNTDINPDNNQESGRRANYLNWAKTVPEYNTKFTIPITIYNTDSFTETKENERNGYPIGNDYIKHEPNNVVIKNQDIEELCESAPDVIPYETDQTEYYNYQLPYYYQNISPKYPIYSPYLPRDRIWRNWKTTEIHMRNVPEFQNNEYDRINRFSTPIMNGDTRYDAYTNMPWYRCYMPYV